MNDHEITSGILDSQHLQRDAGLVIAEEQHPVWFGRIIGWRLHEGQPTMADDKLDLVIGYPMPAGRLQDPDRQRRTP